MAIPLPVIFAGAIILAALCVFIYTRQHQQKRMVSTISGENSLAHWRYAPDEWRKAAAEEFDWVRDKERPGEAFITPDALYITNGSEQFFRDLTDHEKKVTHCSYRGTPGAVLKLRVRWKVSNSSTEYGDETRYYKEDYRVPVPRGSEAEAARVVEHFAARIEAQASAIQDVMPEDSPVSLFGKDEF